MLQVSVVQASEDVKELYFKIIFEVLDILQAMIFLTFNDCILLGSRDSVLSRKQDSEEMGAVMNYSVKIEALSYCYPDGTSALREIGLAAQEGQKIALIGPNGAGKSTLLRAMAGFIRGSGAVTIDGLELCSSNLRKIRTVMGCYMGNPDDHLSMPTVYEDIVFGPLNMNLDVETVRRNVDFALGQMKLTALIKKASCHLSNGQKRMAAIASILSLSPRIILLDEPDIGLDPHNLNNIIRVFGELTQTVVFSTSNMRFAAEAADRVIVLYNGQILADGTVDTILKDERLLATHGLE